MPRPPVLLSTPTSSLTAAGGDRIKTNEILQSAVGSAPSVVVVSSFFNPLLFLSFIFPFYFLSFLFIYHIYIYISISLWSPSSHYSGAEAKERNLMGRVATFYISDRPDNSPVRFIYVRGGDKEDPTSECRKTLCCAVPLNVGPIFSFSSSSPLFSL